MKHLIVNADDLGISRGTNRAIAAAFEHGVLTSASLMINMPATDDALRLIRDQPELQVGLHACLTCGPSILPRDRVSLLVDEAGHFRHSFVGLWRLLRSGQRAAALRQIEAELHGQWFAARRRGLALSHIDSHQHVHMLPGLFSIVAALGREAGVPVRISTEPLRLRALTVGDRVATRAAVGCMKVGLLNHLARRVAARGQAAARSDHCFGILHSGRMTAPVLRYLIVTLPNGLVELITHPSQEGPREDAGSLSAEDRDFLFSPYRRQEYGALLDQEVRGLIEQCGISLLRGHGKIAGKPDFSRYRAAFLPAA
jgi:predicted glycoside hydrolase/deacetylase ChbG (UPF0249 family)